MSESGSSPVTLAAGGEPAAATKPVTIHAIVPAAGTGTRFGGVRPKQFIDLLGRPLLAWTVQRLTAAIGLERVVVAAPPGSSAATQEMLRRETAASPGVEVLVVNGGRRRQDSVYGALKALGPGNDDLIAVHDAARPLLTARDLSAVLEAAASNGVGAVLGRPLRDTLKTVDGGRLGATVDRAGLFRAETPQVLRAAALSAALERAEEDRVEVTDESSLFEPGALTAVAASDPNPKLTDPADREAIEALLRARLSPRLQTHASVGHGYDVHRLIPGRPLILGGQRIPHDRGLDGHSDADVVFHAIGDALLGAAGLGDLGVHFPPEDEAWAGADSSDLLRRIVVLVHARGFRVGNCDVTLIAERPSMAPYRRAIEQRMAEILGVDVEHVGFKATTHEGLGALGRGEGIAAQAVALLERTVGNG